MKFSTREDIDVPIGFAFQKVCDFPRFENQAIKRGAKVHRLDQGAYEIGSTWDTSFKFRGRTRKIQLKIAELDAPETLMLSHDSSGVFGETTVDLVALSPMRTRIIASIELRPKTMPARILVQSLKLAKTNLTSRYKKRVSDFTAQIAADYTAQAKT